MQFEVAYTAADLREARGVMSGPHTDGERAKTKRGMIGWVVAVAVMVAALSLVRHNSGPPAAAPPPPQQADLVRSLLTALVPWLIGFAVLYFVFRVYRNATLRARDAMLDRTQVVDVTADAISMTDGPARTIWHWAAFDRFVETDRLLLLRIAVSQNWVILPNRAIADPADLAAVRGLFAAAAAPASPGFPVVPV